jgi:gamma-D-glutamyl-L-lysine dipeptidyl-peptidase
VNGVTEAVITVPVTSVWTSPDAPRPVDSAVVAAIPDIPRWLALLDNTLRLDLIGRMVTQALFGEPVVVVDERDGWAEVRLPWQPTRSDPVGYPGWLPLAHLSPPVSSRNQTTMVHNRLTVATAVDRSSDREPIVFSMGSALTVLDVVEGDAVVDTPWGRYRVPIAGTATAHFGLVARVLLGVAYLWGGLSGWGVDCSGLVHLANRVVGRTEPRDASDLFEKFGPLRCAAAAQDLVFFRYPEPPQRIHHVGIAVDEHTMLHAPKTGRVVELLPIATHPYGDELQIEAGDGGDGLPGPL